MAKTTPSRRAKSKAPAPKKKPTQLDRIEKSIGLIESKLTTLNAWETLNEAMSNDKLASPTVAVEDIKPKELKVGDWVVSLKDIGDLKKNHVYLVQKTDGFIGLDGVYGGWYPDRFRPATPEEIAAHEAKVKAEAQAAEDAKLVFGAPVEHEHKGRGIWMSKNDRDGLHELAFLNIGERRQHNWHTMHCERHEFTLLP